MDTAGNGTAGYYWHLSVQSQHHWTFVSIIPLEVDNSIAQNVYETGKQPSQIYHHSSLQRIKIYVNVTFIYTTLSQSGDGWSKNENL